MRPIEILAYRAAVKRDRERAERVHRLPRLTLAMLKAKPPPKAQPARDGRQA